jgi:PAS domain S-box-containing protein
MSISKSVDSRHDRGSPARQVAPVPRAHAEHRVQFYGEDSFLLAELSRSIGSALGAGNAAIVLATAEHRAELEARLRQRGIDVLHPAFRDHYLELDAREQLDRFMTGDTPDADRFAETMHGVLQRVSPEDGAPRLIFGEMVALLWEDGLRDAAVRLEVLWNRLAETHDFILHCAYPIQSFDQSEDIEQFQRICDAHTQILPAESYTALPDEVTRLRDIATLQHKAQVLATEIEHRRLAESTLELRKAELAGLLEHALDGIQQIGPDQLILWANKSMLDMLGYSVDELVGHPFRSFFVDEHVFDACWQQLIQRKEVVDQPATLRARDGSLRQVRMYLSALWDGETLLHCRCFTHDVTRQTQMEQMLLERNRELRKAVAVRDDFLSVAAHELKTPATTLRAYAQLILRDLRRQREIPQARMETALGAIEAQSKKLDHLVARLLDTAQIEEGRLRIEPVPTNLALLVRSVVEAQRVSGNHVIQVNLPEQLDAMIDPVRFEQVVTNLLNNAVKFSPEGGTVTVDLGVTAEHAVRLAVTDEGIGIRPEERGAVFSRFYQGNGPRHLSGMGLGLHITREIVNLHGGNIQIQQPVHRGSRFVVTLPAGVAPQSAEAVGPQGA